MIAVVLVLSGFMPIDALSTPPEWESKIGHVALESDADLIAGMNTYRNDCSGCHGDYGQLRSGSGLYPPVPQFNQFPPRLTAPQMFVAAKYGVRYTGMGGWNNEITDKEIWQTVSFLSQMSTLSAAANEAWKAKH